MPGPLWPRQPPRRSPGRDTAHAWLLFLLEHFCFFPVWGRDGRSWVERSRTDRGVDARSSVLRKSPRSGTAGSGGNSVRNLIRNRQRFPRVLAESSGIFPRVRGAVSRSAGVLRRLRVLPAQQGELTMRVGRRAVGTWL